MKELFQGCLKDMEVKNYSPLSILKYSRCLNIFGEFMEKNTIKDIRKVGKDELKAYTEYLMNNPDYSVSYVGSNIRALKLFFRYLYKTGVILFDFSIYLKEPKMPKTLPKEPLTAQEVKAMLEAPDLRTIQGIRDRAILEIFYSTGIRLQEMAQLDLRDLQLEEGLLMVREGKGRKDRMVPIGKNAIFFLKAYLESTRPLYLAKCKTPMERVWLNRRGNPLDKGNIVWMVGRCRKKAGLSERVTAHAFRRTVAVELIRNECDFLTVKTLLGHSRSSTTLRYCALSGVELKEALEKCHPRYEEALDDAVPTIQRMG